jgi:hypothetical protein
MGWMYLLELYHGVTSSFFGIGILYFAGNRFAGFSVFRHKKIP